MKKDWFAAFFDAVMAIIMTIVVLVFPPLVTISIFIAMIVIAIDFAVTYKKKKETNTSIPKCDNNEKA